jgi:ferredoxin
MKIVIDLESCRGYGQCALAAPDIFQLDPEGKSRALDQEPSADRASDVEEAIDACPMHAISVQV